MQPGSDSLMPLWQKCSSLLTNGSLFEHNYPSQQQQQQQQRLQLQQFFDQFRAQFNRDTGADISRPVDFNIPAQPIAEQLGAELESWLRIKSKLTTTANLTERNAFASTTMLSDQAKPNTIVHSLAPSTNFSLKQLPFSYPGHVSMGSGKPLTTSEKSMFPPGASSNIFAHLAHLHRLALTIFSQNNSGDVSATANPFFPAASPSTRTNISSVIFDSVRNGSATELNSLNNRGVPTISTDLNSSKSNLELVSSDFNPDFRTTVEGDPLNMFQQKRKPTYSTFTNSQYEVGSVDSSQSCTSTTQNILGYPMLDREAVHYQTHHRPFLSNPDPWTNHVARSIHNMTPHVPPHVRKTFPKPKCHNFSTNISAREPNTDVERPRLVRLSNSSIKSIDQLTVSDFVTSALHPTSDSHLSPVAATLSEALLNQCGLELCWVKLAYMRERTGSESVVRLLFNISSKRHRLPVGASERIQGRHSSRMLWPQFSAKSFKMHKKLSLDAATDQPFFVHALGWSSIDPCVTWKRWGLVCRQLTVDDICLVLIRQSSVAKKPRSDHIRESQTAVIDRVERNCSCSVVNRPGHEQDEETKGTNERTNAACSQDGATCPFDSLQLGSVRNTTWPKRKSCISEAREPSKICEDSHLNDDNKVGLFKRLKVDDINWRSGDSLDKSSFFSAKSLAQSNDKMSNDGCGEN